MTQKLVSLTINGASYEAWAEPRKLLVDFLRDDLGLTGTHVGCEHGVCGACTILMNGEAVRSCLIFAIQSHKATLCTVEDATDNKILNALRRSFHETHALQCGFCTPGFLMSLSELLATKLDFEEDDIRTALSGNLCRCTGYQNIIRAVRNAAGILADREEL